MLERLTAERYLERVGRRVRPSARFFERALVPSKVAAGLPAMAFDGPPQGLAIDAHLVNRPSSTFLITVKGESMIDIGLMPGDTIVVERVTAANDKDTR